jgi:hypothetical protein
MGVLLLHCGGFLPVLLKEGAELQLLFCLRLSIRHIRHRSISWNLAVDLLNVWVDYLLRIEWYHTRRGMNAAVVCELCQGQPSYPIILLIIYVSAQVLLKSLILPLCLSVRLQMVWGTGPVAYAQVVAGCSPKLGSELRPAIKNNAL